MTITELRKQLYKVVDNVLATGIPAVIDRKGQKLLIVPQEPKQSKLKRLKKRKAIVGDPEDLVNIKVGTWDELKNLK